MDAVVVADVASAVATGVSAVVVSGANFQCAAVAGTAAVAVAVFDGFDTVCVAAFPDVAAAAAAAAASRE